MAPYTLAVFINVLCYLFIARRKKTVKSDWPAGGGANALRAIKRRRQTVVVVACDVVVVATVGGKSVVADDRIVAAVSSPAHIGVIDHVTIWRVTPRRETVGIGFGVADVTAWESSVRDAHWTARAQRRPTSTVPTLSMLVSSKLLGILPISNFFEFSKVKYRFINIGSEFRSSFSK